jgi:hypothetical protein
VSHKSPTSLIVTVAAALILITAVSGPLIALSHALLPVIVAGGIVVAVLRLVFFHTHR